MFSQVRGLPVPPPLRWSSLCPFCVFPGYLPTSVLFALGGLGMEARASTRVREVLLPQAVHLQSCLLLKWLTNVWPSGAHDPKGQVPRESTPHPGHRWPNKIQLLRKSRRK